MPDFRFGRLPSFKLPKATLPKVSLPKTKLPSSKGMWGKEERDQITDATRDAVWKKRFGNATSGKCVCCKEFTIYKKAFVCGHRRSWASGGSNKVSNLEPICTRCNGRMGTKDLVPFCKKLREELKPKTKSKTKTTRKKTTAKKK